MLQLPGAFFRLIRWPNLVFIVITQALFYSAILLPGYTGKPGSWLSLQPVLFWLLTCSSVLIAAAGYIINDYFDLNIDRVNKPDKLVVEKIIKRRWTIIWHWILSGLGVLLGLYVSWRLRNPIVGLGNLGCVILLWFYSTTFKRKLLIGNVIISLLTAWVIIVLWVCEFRVIHPGNINPAALLYKTVLSRLFKYAMVYGGFAFIISLVREVVKDIEDIEGDIRYGCRTMPIVWGINVAKVFAGTWLAVLTGALIVIQFYVLQSWNWIAVFYCFFLLDLPLLWTLRKLYEAQAKADYHLLSTVIKGIMLAGILSMIFIVIHI